MVSPITNLVLSEIPVRQLWAIFEGLVMALSLCQIGSAAPPPKMNHTAVIHFDIKPGNSESQGWFKTHYTIC